jgi:hypothetical protein
MNIPSKKATRGHPYPLPSIFLISSILLMPFLVVEIITSLIILKKLIFSAFWLMINEEEVSTDNNSAKRFRARTDTIGSL